jgi:hypothetical protein
VDLPLAIKKAFIESPDFEADIDAKAEEETATSFVDLDAAFGGLEPATALPDGMASGNGGYGDSNLVGAGGGGGGGGNGGAGVPGAGVPAQESFVDLGASAKKTETETKTGTAMAAVRRRLLPALESGSAGGDYTTTAVVGTGVGNKGGGNNGGNNGGVPGAGVPGGGVPGAGNSQAFSEFVELADGNGDGGGGHQDISPSSWHRVLELENGTKFMEGTAPTAPTAPAVLRRRLLQALEGGGYNGNGNGNNGLVGNGVGGNNGGIVGGGIVGGGIAGGGAPGAGNSQVYWDLIEVGESTASIRSGSPGGGGRRAHSSITDLGDAPST